MLDWSANWEAAIGPPPPLPPFEVKLAVTPNLAPVRAAPLGSLPSRREATELLDETGHNPVELAANLRDIRLVNRLGGGTRVVLRHLPALLAEVPPDREAIILDLATGSADIPLAIIAWARRRGQRLRMVASDGSDEILAVAGRRVQRADAVEAIQVVRYDALAVPLPDGAVDIVLCSLALHHFAPPDATRLLREMARLGRHGFILNDICRSMPGYAAAWLSSRLATHNRLTRHDMPLSVLRAYTPTELSALLDTAAITDATVHRHPLFRMAAVRVPQSAVRGPRGTAANDRGLL